MPGSVEDQVPGDQETLISCCMRRTQSKQRRGIREVAREVIGADSSECRVVNPGAVSSTGVASASFSFGRVDGRDAQLCSLPVTISEKADDEDRKDQSDENENAAEPDLQQLS